MRERVFRALTQGATLLTANRRLARRWRFDFHRHQQEQGLGAWPTPAIQAWEDWLTAAEERSLSERLLLTGFAERYLWERIIDRDDRAGLLLDRASTAAAAAQARALAVAWRVSLDDPAFADTEDTAAFARWARELETQCRRRQWVPPADLADVATPVAAELWLAGFDELTPQQLALLERLDRPWFRVESEARAAGWAERAAFPDAEAELRAAAAWARERIEAGEARTVGVVVQGLAEKRRMVEAIFTETLGGPHFNISLGEPLAGYPMIAAALATLRLANTGLAAAELSAWLLSPFLLGGMSEHLARAHFDARLRTRKITEAGPARLLALGAEAACPRLGSVLGGLAAPGDRLPPSGWAEVFLGLLRAAGWPGERTLSSTERQTEQRWQRVLDSFAALDVVEGRLSYGQALRLLGRLLEEEIFQPESQELPVQILEALQAAGSSYDALWVQGMDDREWPAAARPTPFLPYRLQRERNLPHATAERELRFARTIVERLQESAPHVVFSYAHRDGESELRPSRLILALPERGVAPPRYPTWAETIRAAAVIEEFEDVRGPEMAEGARLASGTHAIKAQSQCPFQGFALARLRAEKLERPEAGLDFRDRGTVLHRALELFWRRCRDHATLTSTDWRPVLEGAVAEAIAELPAEERTGLLEIERLRLLRTLGEWLEVEAAREPFRVIEFERRRELSLDGLTLEARADRVDQLADGTRMILDYKTGLVDPRQWDGPRPEEPQLPIYAITADPAPAQVAFAQVRRGECALAARPVALDEWRAEISVLTTELRTGHAAVDPRDGGAPCAYCHLKTLCRIAEVKADA